MVVMHKGSIDWRENEHNTCVHSILATKTKGVTFDSVDVIELDSLEECIVFDEEDDEDEVDSLCSDSEVQVGFCPDLNVIL